VKEKVISGIQQIGIGVPDVREAWKWYKKNFGVDIRMFEDSAVAQYMLPYTGGKPQKRHAALALNLQGGGGFEIWQYIERKPLAAAFTIQLGDLGLFAAKIKCHDVKIAYDFLKSNGVEMVSGLLADPRGKEHFFVKDPYGNIFQLVTSFNWFRDEKKPTGAAYGAIIGVSDITRAKEFYNSILGYDTVVKLLYLVNSPPYPEVILKYAGCCSSTANHALAHSVHFSVPVRSNWCRFLTGSHKKYTRKGFGVTLDLFICALIYMA
jgi:catechol 2,3-dioxygenase-like lactoylglutathione lyase family enzyme